MCSPDDYLKIPNPSDISAAVSRALCLTENEENAASNSTTKLEDDYVLTSSLQLTDESPFFTVDIEQSLPEDFNVDILEIEGNLEQLERFCRFIDSPTPDKRNTEVSRIKIMEKDPDWEPGRNYCVEYANRSANHKTRSQRRKRTELAAAVSSKKHCQSVLAFQNKLPLYKPESTITKDSWSVTLINADNWRLFYASGTEMIITKAGRRMFPWVSVQVKGLEPESEYSIKIDFISADDNRYKYVGDEWIAVGKVELKLHGAEHAPYKLPPPHTGETLMRENDINFRSVKLTNNKATKHKEHQVILNSMQKYQPRVKITSLEGIDKGTTHHFSFPETVFIAVTAYQSDKITQLKIRYNPYAKAFREDVTLTSETGETCSKPGGHAKRMKKNKNHHSRPTSPTATPSPVASLESGFESGSGTGVESALSDSKPCTPQKLHVKQEIVPKLPTKLQPNKMLCSVISEPPLQPLGGGCLDQRYSLCYDQDVLISPPAENLIEQSFSEPYLRQYLSSCESQWSYYSPLKTMRTLHLTPSPLPSPLLKWQSPNNEEIQSPFIHQSPFKVEDDVFYT